MLQTWRWFGPHDPISLAHVRQAGVEGIVTALHHLPAGAAWTDAEIEKRCLEISRGSRQALKWEVVESLPVSESIKTQNAGMKADLVNYVASLEALARAGIRTVCYNFMPVLDWTRTQLRWPLDNGGTAMRFEWEAFATFDLFVLRRQGAEHDYPESVGQIAQRRFSEMNDSDIVEMTNTIGAGLPGSADHWSLESLRSALQSYAAIDRDKLRQNHIDFLSEVVPTAERLKIRLCCHPDDPPFPLLGLPRIMSTEDDYAALLDAVPSHATGMTFCTGSLGARPDNDCAAIARRFGPRIHFAHLRNVTRDADTVPCSFFEDEHLKGQTDMVAVVRALLEEEARRAEEGRWDAQIPMRPDHGQEILSDIGSNGQPGYPAVGRLKGLAELRGVIAGLQAQS